MTGSNATAPPSVSPRLAICLSGGGLRATFFHLGVIRFLRRHRLLDGVAEISSVSGGSILAAHLVLNWTRYIGSDDEYNKAEREVLALGTRDIRGRVLRRWLLSIAFPLIRIFPRLAHRTYLLEREYSRFFKDSRLRDLTPGDGDRPALHILATSFTTGNLCSFSDKGFWIHRDGMEPKLFATTVMPVALAVASSSAFPPLFPPTAITRKMLRAPNSELSYDPEYLTDGGVFDNLALARFARNSESPTPRIDHIIVSDAGAQLDMDIEGRFAWIISRTVRSTNILMQRVANFTIGRSHLDKTGPEVLHLRISTEVWPGVGPHPVIIDFQKLLPQIRTDLNRFTPLEMDLLLRHGYEVAWDGLMNLVPSKVNASAEEASTPDLTNEQIDSVLASLEKSKMRGIGLFNIRDWLSFALLFYLFAIVGVGLFPYFYVAKEVLRPSKIVVPFATDRMRDESGRFTGDRVEELRSGWTTVNIPPEHRYGQLEVASGALPSLLAGTAGAFSMEPLNVDVSLGMTFRGSGRKFVYVPGFNTTFESGVLKTAQIAYDTRYQGGWFTYSWPSRGEFAGYLYDNDSVSISLANFYKLITMIKNGDAGTLDIIAEGLGARLLLDLTDGQLAGLGQKPFGQLVFLIPDVDRLLFIERVQRLVPLADRITLLISSNSQLIRASRVFSRNPRAGDGQDPLVLPNVETVVFRMEDSKESDKAITTTLGSILSGAPLDRALVQLRAVPDAKTIHYLEWRE